jgi:hypothetical protein
MLEVGTEPDFFQVVLRKRYSCSIANDGDIFAAFGTAFFQQVVVDLAAHRTMRRPFSTSRAVDFGITVWNEPFARLPVVEMASL